MRKYAAGDVIEFLFAPGDTADQAASSLKNDGHEILSKEDQDNAISVTIRKAG